MVKTLAPRTGLLGVVALLAAMPANAVPARYNFLTGVPPGTAADPLYSGVGVLGNGGAATAVWNTVNWSGSGDLNITTNAQDTSGNLSPVIIEFHAQGQSNNAAANPISAQSDQALLQNYAISKGGVIDAIDLSGLPADAKYTIVFYGTDGPDSRGDHTTRFSILNGEAGQAGTLVLQEATTTETTDSQFQTPANYVEMTGQTDDKGRIFAAFAGDFNGLQIQIGE